MAFSEKIKKEVRKLSDGRCVICHEAFVEIHHIIPQCENGEDTMENAVALCARCHDIFGDSPSKRKQLKELRDMWYEKVEVARTPCIIEKYRVCEKIKVVEKAKEKPNEKKVAIYHVVYADEDFDSAAKALFELTRKAIEEVPSKPRVLYLDIDGHRLKDGAFDNDMWELQFYFILQNLLYYYTEIHLPIVNLKNPYQQLDEPLDGELVIYKDKKEFKDLEGSLFTIGEFRFNCLKNE